MLLILGIVMFLGLLLKLPCASGEWSDGRHYRRFCYTDIVPLYLAYNLDEARLPYLEVPNEYPVALGLFMWVMALPVEAEADFFLLNVLVLSLAAAFTALMLYRLAGSRALLFAAAPTLFLYGFLNWDVLPVALATAGLGAHFRDRPGLSGALLGAGTATKLYPGLLIPPLVLEREREGRRADAVRMFIVAAGVWLLVNVPIAALDFREWSLFFRFNTARIVDWGTLWFVGCHLITGRLECSGTGVVNLLSAVTFLGGAVLIWRLKVRRDPDLPRWTLGFPLLVLFLLTTKVYSPQYSLWLLPFFALVDPDIRRFLAFEAADLAVFLTEFSWLGRHTGFGGLPVEFMEVAVLARAAVLVWYLVAYVKRPSSEAVRPKLPRLTTSGTT